jgi:hypothetical protein
MADDLTVIDVNDVVSWQETVEVVVVGLGIAGACAALEAHATGAEVLVLERSGGGGGSSIVSSGIFYLGGGTPVQEAAGFEDDADNMYRFLMASTGAPDAVIVRAYCQGNVEHFGWLEAQGVPFERTYFPGKSVILTTTTCLFSTGSEKVWPFREVARPVPRGHKVAGAGEHAGSVGMNAILDTVAAQQVTVTAARTLAGRLVADLGSPIELAGDHHVTQLFPTAEALTAVDPAAIAMPRARGRALVALASAVADATVVLDRSAERADVRAALLAIPGIGPWTADYIAFRVLGDPDVFLPTDVGVRRAAEQLGLDDVARHSEQWRPWRSYALIHLWSSLGDPGPAATTKKES